MLTKSARFILSCLALLGIVHAETPPGVAGCTARAWVRAPDLSPDTIVQGDARVKISAGCSGVEAVSLVLRLRERSFIKAIRSQEDREWMQSVRRPEFINPQPASPWSIPTSHFSNPRDYIAFREILLNKDLWFIREEERVAFETTQTIHMAEGHSGELDIVEDFAVLVPSTNFPPALDIRTNPYIGDELEMADAELMYDYLVRVTFANGTMQEILAGYTSFHPLHDIADASQPPNPGTSIKLEPLYVSDSQKDSFVEKYTAQVSDLVFTEGSTNQTVTVVITRTGSARTFPGPFRIFGHVEPTISSKWAIDYDLPSLKLLHKFGGVLRSTLEDDTNRPCFCHYDDSIMMPDSTSDEIQSHSIVTTSAAVTIPIHVDRQHVTNFETYYETLSNSLQITLEVPSSTDKTVDPDGPSTGVSFWIWDPDFSDDEEPWVPWPKKVPREPYLMPGITFITYSGNIPAIVHPMSEAALLRCPPTDMDTFVQDVLSDDVGCKRRSLIHYLDEGARGPTFVKTSAVEELLAKDAAERALYAPILDPVVSSPPAGEELIYRYSDSLGGWPIYVGETWETKWSTKKGKEN